MEKAGSWSLKWREPKEPSLKLSVITPTYNERNNIGPLISEISRALKGISFEIIIADDNSPDLTWLAASEIAAQDPRVRVIRRTRNRGLAASVIDGFAVACGEVVACIDADLQHDPGALPMMLRRIEAGADVAVGSRYMSGGSTGNWGWPRRAVSRVATRLAQSSLGITLSDPMSGYFMLRRLDFLNVQAELGDRGFKILLEILVRLQPEKIAEVPYTFRTRRSGNSKLTSAIVFDYVAQLRRLSKQAAVRHSGDHAYVVDRKLRAAQKL